MSQGAFGPIGPVGPTGMTGRRGRQGDGFGPTGANLFSGGLLTLVSVTNVNYNPPVLTVTASSSGTHYSLFDDSVMNGQCTLTLPTSGLSSGMYWGFYNENSAYKIRIDLINGNAVYNGNSLATFVEIAPRNGCIIAYSGTAGIYIVF
jgi:hypothetical protein